MIIALHRLRHIKRKRLRVWVVWESKRAEPRPKFMSDNLPRSFKEKYKERKRENRTIEYGDRFARCSRGRYLHRWTNGIEYDKSFPVQTHPSLRR